MKTKILLLSLILILPLNSRAQSLPTGGVLPIAEVPLLSESYKAYIRWKNGKKSMDPVPTKSGTAAERYPNLSAVERSVTKIVNATVHACFPKIQIKDLFDLTTKVELARLKTIKHMSELDTPGCEPQKATLNCLAIRGTYPHGLVSMFVSDVQVVAYLKEKYPKNASDIKMLLSVLKKLNR